MEMEKMNFVSRSREIVKFKDVNEIMGKMTGKRKREVTDRKTGELKEITDLCLDTPDGKQIAVAIDTGLRVALSSSDINEGDFIKICHKGKEDLPNGNRVNKYEILVAQ
jgi:hypothetical protein